MFGFKLVIVAVIGYFIIFYSRVQHKGSLLLKKIMTALISTFVYTISLAYLEYIPFDSLFLISIWIVLPIFLIGGGLYAFLIDMYVNRIRFSSGWLIYITKMVLYSLGGTIISIILLMPFPLVDGGEFHLLDWWKFIVFTSVPALLFYHISLLLNMTATLIKR